MVKPAQKTIVSVSPAGVALFTDGSTAKVLVSSLQKGDQVLVWHGQVLQFESPTIKPGGNLSGTLPLLIISTGETLMAQDRDRLYYMLLGQALVEIGHPSVAGWQVIDDGKYGPLIPGSGYPLDPDDYQYNLTPDPLGLSVAAPFSGEAAKYTNGNTARILLCNAPNIHQSLAVYINPAMAPVRALYVCEDRLFGCAPVMQGQPYHAHYTASGLVTIHEKYIANTSIYGVANTPETPYRYDMQYLNDPLSAMPIADRVAKIAGIYYTTYDNQRRRTDVELGMDFGAFIAGASKQSIQYLIGADRYESSWYSLHFSMYMNWHAGVFDIDTGAWVESANISSSHVQIPSARYNVASWPIVYPRNFSDIQVLLYSCKDLKHPDFILQEKDTDFTTCRTSLYVADKLIEGSEWENTLYIPRSESDTWPIATDPDRIEDRIAAKTRYRFLKSAHNDNFDIAVYRKLKYQRAEQETLNFMQGAFLVNKHSIVKQCVYRCAVNGTIIELPGLLTITDTLHNLSTVSNPIAPLMPDYIPAYSDFSGLHLGRVFISLTSESAILCLEYFNLSITHELYGVTDPFGVTYWHYRENSGRGFPQSVDHDIAPAARYAYLFDLSGNMIDVSDSLPSVDTVNRINGVCLIGRS